MLLFPAHGLRRWQAFSAAEAITSLWLLWVIAVEFMFVWKATSFLVFTSVRRGTGDGVLLYKIFR